MTENFLLSKAPRLHKKDAQLPVSTPVYVGPGLGPQRWGRDRFLGLAAFFNLLNGFFDSCCALQFEEFSLQFWLRVGVLHALRAHGLKWDKDVRSTRFDLGFRVLQHFA